MYISMSIQDTAVDKGFTTHIRDVRMLSSMYMTMSIQSIPVGKGHTTHIKYIYTLPSMYMTSIQSASVGKDTTHTLQM
jgi:hypothetical protein